MQIISDSYILGIKEGRSFLSNNPDLTLSDMQACLDNCKRLARDFSQPIKDVFKGEADFWANQIKRKA